MDADPDPRMSALTRANGPRPLARRWSTLRTIGGLRFVVASPGDAARDLIDAALEGEGGDHVHLANAYSVAVASQHPALAATTFSTGWNLPDGRPLSVVSRFRRDRPPLQQVRGPQLMLDVCRAGTAPGVRHYLLGASEEVRAKLEAKLRAEFPGILIVGGGSPPFRTPTADELQRRDQDILSSGAHVVWVGLGTPKQDVEAERLARDLPVIAVAVGAAFDYAAGTLRMAPRWVQRLGFEWVFRLGCEPRRLWKRYLTGNLRFLRVVLLP